MIHELYTMYIPLPFLIIWFILSSSIQDVMGMTKEEFCALPAWRQINIKKEVDLY